MRVLFISMIILSVHVCLSGFIYFGLSFFDIGGFWYWKMILSFWCFLLIVSVYLLKDTVYFAERYDIYGELISVELFILVLVQLLFSLGIGHELFFSSLGLVQLVLVSYQVIVWSTVEMEEVE